MARLNVDRNQLLIRMSNTQRYKCIGNGWTVDVVAHIMQGIHEGYALKTENRQFGRGQDGQFTFDDLLA